MEYEELTSLKTGSFQEIVNSASVIKSFIDEKRRCYDIYLRYAHYFLGADVSSKDAKYWSREDIKHLNSLNEDGMIDYTPYLKMLGIDNLDELHSGLADVIRSRKN